MSDEATDFDPASFEFVDKLQGLLSKREILGTVEAALVGRPYRGAAS